MRDNASAVLQMLQFVHPRCGQLATMCAFLNDTSLPHANGYDDWNGPPRRNALVISNQHNFIRAAAEVRRAGFWPIRIGEVISNSSRCHPAPNMSDTEMRRAVKFVNMGDAYRQALQYIIKTNMPHAIFEHDIVLATSGTEVQRWLDDLSPTAFKVEARFPNGSSFHTTVRASRNTFDYVPLGTCGKINFACGHAVYITPAGARLLSNTFGHTCERQDMAYDLKTYIDPRHPYSHGAKVCSRLCDPNRTRTPRCWDDEARTVVANRRCSTGANRSLWNEYKFKSTSTKNAFERDDLKSRQSLSVNQCGDRGEALRCVDWRQLYDYQSQTTRQILQAGNSKDLQQRTHGMTSNGFRFGSRFFDPRRYHGYGHFLQDRLAIKSHFCIIILIGGLVNLQA